MMKINPKSWFALARKCIRNESKVIEAIDDHEVLVNRTQKLKIGVINPQLASELAYHIAKFTHAKVLLIDADAMMPTVAECLGMKERVNNRIDFGSKSASSFKMAMDYMATSKPTADILKTVALPHQNNRNLSVLVGDNNLFNFETYSLEAFKGLMNLAHEAYDLVVVHVRYEVYDEFFGHVNDTADFMLYGLEAYADNLLSYVRLNTFLTNLDWSTDNHYLVPFSYDSSCQLGHGDLKHLIGQNLLPAISASKIRQSYRCATNRCYAGNMTKKNTYEYHRLAKSLGFITKKSFWHRR